MRTQEREADHGDAVPDVDEDLVLRVERTRRRNRRRSRWERDILASYVGSPRGQGPVSPAAA